MPFSWGKTSPGPAAAPPAFDLEVYFQSIEKLRRLTPLFLAYSHDGVTWEPEEFISRAVENTRIWGDLVLSALKDGDDIEAIVEKMREYIKHRFGVTVEQIDRVTLEGYIFYFKRNGLV